MLREYPHDNLGPAYRPDAIFLPRISFEPFGTLPGAEGGFDRRLCMTLPLYRSQQVIVPEGVMHPLCRDLLQRSGIDPLPERQCLLYKDRESYKALLDHVPAKSLLVDHPHPLGALDPEKYRVPRELLLRLLDKVYLEEWVPEDFLAPRVVVPEDRMLDQHGSVWSGGYGCFLKPAGPYPTGGGFGIVFVKRPEDFAIACEAFPKGFPLVLEALIPHQVSYCVNLIFPEPVGSEYFLLGVSEQWIQKGHQFKGSCLRDPKRISPSILTAVSTVAERIKTTSYVGVVGLDILDTEEGLKIVDLNPRTNFSTGPLLYTRRFREQFGAEPPFYAFTVQIKKERKQTALAYLYSAIARNHLVVIRAYHDTPDSDYAFSLGVILVVDTPLESQQFRQEMLENGLEF